MTETDSGQTRAMVTLRDVMRKHVQTPEHPALTQLSEKLQQQYGSCLAGILFYGSCLRSGDPYDGLVDLYLVVDRYTCAFPNSLKAIWNWLLPPNVFYVELAVGDNIIRAKYAVLSINDLKKGTSKRWFHSYLWGRFTQPTAIVWWRDEKVRVGIENSLATAVLTFLNRSIPGIPTQGSLRSLWSAALQLSYRTELRVEKAGRAQELIDHNIDWYQQITDAAAPLLHYPLEINLSDKNKNQYQSHIPWLARTINRPIWFIRSIQGKCLSLARLIKALFTFDGGLDYIAWKLERHSGVHIDIPDRVRRFPLIFIWGLFWKLYRRGIFR